MNTKEIENIKYIDNDIISFVDALFERFFELILCKYYIAASNDDYDLKKNLNMTLLFTSVPDIAQNKLKWLDESTRFIFKYDEDNNPGLLWYNDGSILVKTTYDDIKYKICGANIKIPFTISDNLEDVYNNDDIIKRCLSSAKSTLVHEISHVKTDYENLVSIEDKKLSNKNKRFNDAYNNIMKYIHSKNEYERYLSNIVYYTNDYESFSYVSEFYQELLNNIEIFKERLNDISAYKFYKIYDNINKSIDHNVIDISSFEKFKQDIIDIFNTSCDTIKGFKTNIKFICDDILDEMQKLYHLAKIVESDFFDNNTKRLDVIEAEKQYREYKDRVLKDKLKSVREDYIPVFEAYYNNYNKTKIDKQIEVLKKFLELCRKH